MSNKDYLPIKYDTLFFEESIETDPVYVIQTSSVPFSISIGDKIDTKSWGCAELPPDKIYKVIDVIHYFFPVASSHISYSLNIVVSMIDRNVKSD